MEKQLPQAITRSNELGFSHFMRPRNHINVFYDFHEETFLKKCTNKKSTLQRLENKNDLILCNLKKKNQN